MIAKQIKGKGFRGVVAYNHRKVREGQAILLETNLSGNSVNLLAKEFHSIARLRPNLSKCVYHVSLNLPASENIADVVFAELAQDYLEGMGFADNQYLIYRHFDCDHHHIHIVANRVRFDGNVVSDSMDYRRSESLVRELELKYGLEQVVHSSLLRTESKNGYQNVPIGDVKREIRAVLGAALEHRPPIQSFLEQLAEQDIFCHFNRSRSTGYVSGIRFYCHGMVLKGSQLGKGYGWKGISSKLDDDQQRDGNTIVAYQERHGYLFLESSLDPKESPKNANLSETLDFAPSDFLSPLFDTMDMIFQPVTSLSFQEQDDGPINIKKKKKKHGKQR